MSPKPPAKVTPLSAARDTRVDDVDKFLDGLRKRLREERAIAVAVVFVDEGGSVASSFCARESDAHALHAGVRRLDLYLTAPELFDGEVE